MVFRGGSNLSREVDALFGGYHRVARVIIAAPVAYCPPSIRLLTRSYRLVSWNSAPIIGGDTLVKLACIAKDTREGQEIRRKELQVRRCKQEEKETRGCGDGQEGEIAFELARADYEDVVGFARFA